jgi:uncharacterized protein YdeI (YjbR/CyaY-like superfamily)
MPVIDQPFTSATRVARIEKARPAIFEGRGFLERR